MRYNKSMFVNDTLRVAITNVCDSSAVTSTDAKYMSIDTARSIADFVRANRIKIRELNITGGEPMLHPQALEIIKILKEGCFEGVKEDNYIFNLDSNINLLTEDTIDTLKKAGVNQLTIGVDENLGTILNPTSATPIPEVNLDTLNYARCVMETTFINTLIVDDDKIEQCYTNSGWLHLPKPVTENYGCVAMGNIPIGDSKVAKYMRQRPKKDRYMELDWWGKITIPKMRDDYRDNVTTYIAERDIALARSKGKSTSGMGVVALSKDFTDYASTDVGYTVVDIDGNTTLCKMPIVKAENRGQDGADNFDKLPSTNVRDIKIKYVKTIGESGETILTPEYSLNGKRKESMGE